ncbi:hypothetical protein GCM10023340_25200 [Nocardioides marinquilinus]|uniref:DUF3137 domain-containing protein n=1 Tax=Nocardioides marinquilinus TaxID=1210400 RepID=A0ABP9PNM7_9ACTN
MGNLPDWVYGLIVWIGGCVVVGGGLALWRRLRLRRLERTTSARGWRYRAEAPELVGVSQGPPFGPLGARVTGVVEGREHGREFVAFRYQRDDPSSGEGTSTSRFGVVAFPLPFSGVPVVHVSTRADAAAWSLPAWQPAPTGLEAFDRERTVLTTRPETARALLTPALAELVLAHPAWVWRVDDHALLVLRRRREFDAAELERVVAFGAAVLDHLEPALRASH